MIYVRSIELNIRHIKISHGSVIVMRNYTCALTHISALAVGHTIQLVQQLLIISRLHWKQLYTCNRHQTKLISIESIYWCQMHTILGVLHTWYQDYVVIPINQLKCDSFGDAEIAYSQLHSYKQILTGRTAQHLKSEQSTIQSISWNEHALIWH